MDRDRFERVQGLFERACDLEAAERSRLLDAECGDDEDLRRRVERMLAHDIPTEDPLGSAVASAVVGLTDSDGRHGELIGPYRLDHELGRGGMGTVWLAERDDGEFRQRVALKLIRRGMDSAQILDRFRRERQIMANLQHPNIARLLDGGVTADGRPYFAMEYVAGLPIDRYCDERRADVDERLDLFERTARAVAHAHTNLVVHRDLKPDNILVTDEGEVRLLDFGIAKLLAEDESPDVTRQEQRVLTPGYASPEQLRGEPITTATDVYSLGIVLFELLTGQRPHDVDGRTPAEMERVVTAEAPPRPSRRTATPVHDDLDRICLKALHPEVSRRYASVEAFLEDIDRFRRGLPVRARPDSAAYRLRKAVGRHRAAFAAGAAGCLLVGGTVAFYTARLARERDAARVEASKASQVAKFLRNVFEVSHPSGARGESVTARELLDSGAERIERDLADQPEVQALMLRVIGEVYHSLGLDRQARPLLERALEQQLARQTEDVETARTHSALGIALQDLGLLDEAVTHFEAALQGFKTAHPADHPDICHTLSHLGVNAENRGDFERAERFFRASIECSEAGGDPEGISGIAAARLGRLLRRLERGEEAETLLRDALVSLERSFGPRSLRVASARRNLGALLRDQGRLDEAEAYYREALEIRRTALGERHSLVGTTLSSFAALYEARGDWEEAVRLRQEAQEIADATLESPHPTLAALRHNLGVTQRSAGNHRAALESFRESLAMQEQLGLVDHPNRAFPLWGIGASLLALDDPAAALPYLREALALREEGLPAGHRHTVEARVFLGRCLAALERHEAAESALARALSDRTKSLGPDDERTRALAQELARLRERR